MTATRVLIAGNRTKSLLDKVDTRKVCGADQSAETAAQVGMHRHCHLLLLSLLLALAVSTSCAQDPSRRARSLPPQAATPPRVAIAYGMRQRRFLEERSRLRKSLLG